MSGWIKFWKDTSNDPRLIEAAQRLAETYVLATRTPAGGCDLSAGDALRFTANALRGALTSLWCYADEHIRMDDTLPISSDSLDAMIGIEGFSALLPADWISVMDDGTIKLPGYCVKNDLIAKEKRRADGKARTASYRQRHKSVSNGVHNAIVTQTVTRHNVVTNGVDQDQDQDLNLDPKEGERLNGAVHKIAPKRGTRIPDDFTLTESRRAYAISHAVEPDPTFALFTTYWRSASGTKATKMDWDQAWQNWVLREAADTRKRNAPRPGRYDQLRSANGTN